MFISREWMGNSCDENEFLQSKKVNNSTSRPCNHDVVLENSDVILDSI